MNKQRTRKKKYLSQQEYNALKVLLGLEQLPELQVVQLTGWSASTVNRVKLSRDYEDYCEAKSRIWRSKNHHQGKAPDSVVSAQEVNATPVSKEMLAVLRSMDIHLAQINERLAQASTTTTKQEKNNRLRLFGSAQS